MSTGNKPPPGKGTKPFLGDDDNELDAWDSMFDDLHAGPEGGAPAAEEVMAWPAPAAPPERIEATAISASGSVASEIRIEVDEGLDEQMTLDRAIEGDDDGDDDLTLDPIPMPQGDPLATLDVDPLETDFSDVGASGSPAALGSLLGRPDAPDFSDEEEGQTRIGQMPLPAYSDENDEEVFTSASRPAAPAPPPSAPFDEGPLAAPPPPPVVRRPAIVRRTPPPVPPVEDHRRDEPTPPGGHAISQFAEQTRVAHISDVEARAADMRSRTPTAQPIVIDEDAYDDIEIGDQSGDKPAEVAAKPQRTAHLLRRGDAPTRPPPIAELIRDQGAEIDDVIEMSIDETPLPRAAPSIAEEDDFSDVAAAVGAADDGALVEPVIPQRRPSTPMGAARGDRTSGPVAAVAPPPPPKDLMAALDDLEGTPAPKLEPRPPTLDDALDALDDEPERSEATTISVAPQAPVAPQASVAESSRPPALVDLYPRVKTPTSVPPIGETAPRPNKWGSDAAPLRTIIADGAVPAPVASSGSSPQPAARPSRPDDGPTSRTPRLATPMALPPDGDAVPDVEPLLDLDAVGRTWPEQQKPIATSRLDEEQAAALLVYEREIATVDDPAVSAALRTEAARLSERLNDLERARGHYDAALLADPRATVALRGLRRIARQHGDLVEATRHLEAEIAVAGALERRPLGHYRIDLLMASGDQDLARVAVGELIDSAPSDVRALLAQLELAFLDGRADEFGVALEQLAHAVSDPQLRAAVQSARGVLAAHHNDTGAATGWFAAAAESDPSSLAARLGAVRHAAAQNNVDAAARALVDVAQQIQAQDPITAAAAAIRAQQWAAVEGTAAIATASAGDDPLVARLAAEAATGEGEAAAFAHWARHAASPAERVYAAARAAELDANQAAELWSVVLASDPDDDYAAAQLRTAHVTVEHTQEAIDVDLAVAGDIARDRARLRAAYGLIGLGKLDEALEVLQRGRAERPGALAISEALAEALAAAGKWTERAALLAELASEPGDQLDGEVAQLRSALAWEEAVGAASAEDAPAGSDVQALTGKALEAWEKVLEHQPSPNAHAASILLANRLGDRQIIADALLRAQQAERAPYGALSLALRRARLLLDDPQLAESILREANPGLDDPRRTIALVVGAARRKEPAEAAQALEERAALLDERTAQTEIAALRLRAAQLSLDAGDAARATTLLGKVEQALPHVGVIPDLLAAARRRAGDRPTASTVRHAEPTPGVSSNDAFARIVRDADLAAAHGDAAGAVALYQRALELKPGDPLAAVPLVRVATQLRDPAPLAALALAQLRAAEAADDALGKAEAYELLAGIDAELRDDPSSAQVALESASQADRTRLDLLHRLARGYADQLGELIKLRRAELDALPPETARDRAALLVDIAGLAVRDQRPDAELTELYRAALDADAKARLPLLHLEAIVRRAGFTAELAALEEKIALYFEGDAKTQAAFWTRAGETYAEIGQIDLAVQRFGRADAVLPGHIPALEGWRAAALKGQLWIDVGDAASRQAAVTQDAVQRARLHHFAGVTLMDKALVGEQAMSAFQRAIEADPSHKDAFLRLRILLEEDANHDELASLLAKRLAVESDRVTKIELHRALAELHRNFLSDRETAKVHYHAILADDPSDLRAHAAIADIAWEQGAWKEAADALMARARLESQPEILKTLCFRLGLIYADRLVDIEMALRAFQRALTYAPDDENTLVRLADLATQAGEWKLALGACERLVKQEADPDRRASHLQRVAKIFKDGFNDTKRAERALNLALDGAPTNDDALQALVAFYKDANDNASVRVHLNRVVGVMRARVQADPKDGIAYRVISRAMTARAVANVPGSLPIARAAAELADGLGAGGDAEAKLVQLSASHKPDLSLLVKPESDDVLFPRVVQQELRQMFQLLGDRVAKHVGVDLRPYGATRGDRLRARDNPVAAIAQEVATALGFGEIDVYVSARQPWAMVAEPTSPVSLVIGQSIASLETKGAVRFAAGAALKLAQASLAIPARLPPEELGVLVVALVKLFQPDFPTLDLDEGAITAQAQKLRRLIPSGLMNDLRPFALAVDGQRFHYRQLAGDLKLAGLRAGLVASGSILAGLRLIAGDGPTELTAVLADPLAQGLVQFALSEDHANLAR